MELLLFIIGPLVILALRGRSRRLTPRRRPSQPRRIEPKPPYRASALTPARQPFDAKTATHLNVSETLTGAAYVIDGDSIVIKKTQVRLFGVDAPEMNHPYGKKAKWALVALCKGQTIRAEITDRDSYGRTVARCFLPDGRDLSAEMVKQGLAIDWPKFSGGIYRALEVSDARKKMWLADARQKGRMHVWDQFDVRRKAKNG